MAEKEGICWNCSERLAGADYGRQDTCNNCGKATKVCRNCNLYDPSLNNECKEPQADRVVEKERSNFCDYFSPGNSEGGKAQSVESMKASLDALFKK